MRELGVAVLGCGTVGSAVVRRLRARGDDVVAVAVRDRSRERDTCGAVPSTDDPVALVERDDVDIVVETMGGIETARACIERAIALDKPVITANKALLAAAGPRLQALAADRGVELRYEAAVGAGIPLLRGIEALRSDTIVRIEGVLNGTSNFALEAMRNGASLESALAEARRMGYAEADAGRDVLGLDAADKIVLLSRLAFGTDVASGDVACLGIDWLDCADMARADNEGRRWRLVASATRAGCIRVEPVLVGLSSPLYDVTGADNAVVVTTERSGVYVLRGPGAGGEATATAVVADLDAVIATRALHARAALRPVG